MARMSTTSPTVHTYSVTVSRMAWEDGLHLILSMPPKYYDCRTASPVLSEHSQLGTGIDQGSFQVFFEMTATKANAFRKWLERRYNGTRQDPSIIGRRQRTLKFHRLIPQKIGFVTLASHLASGAGAFSGAGA